MPAKLFRFLWRLILILGATGLIGLFLPRIITTLYAMNRIYQKESAPDKGRRTYDTCYRAKEVFGVTSALLVTQKFHLPRALFLCNALGLDASGVEANNRRFWRGSMLSWNVREQFATVGAFPDVYVNNPYPVLGEPEPLFVD